MPVGNEWGTIDSILDIKQLDSKVSIEATKFKLPFFKPQGGKCGLPSSKDMMGCL